MTKATNTSTDLAKAQTTAVGEAYNYGEDAGSGFEGTKGSDLSIPFIGILQSNSPQVEDKNPAGAEPGKLINTVTNELIGGEEGLPFLPVHKEQAFVEWVPRLKGGGFVALHDVGSDTVKKAQEAAGPKHRGKLILANENELIETFYVYGLILNKEGTETQGFAVISFTSTKISPYRDWTTSMYLLKGKPPLFANRALIKTQKQKNEKGSFYNFDIKPLLSDNWAGSLINPVTSAHLLKEAKDFREMVLSGMARAAHETQNNAGGEGAGNSDGSDAPF